MSDQRNETRLLREIEALERELAHRAWVISQLADRLALCAQQLQR
jgi:hypothetical protein